MASVNEDLKSVGRRLDGIIELTNTATGTVSLVNGDEVLFTLTTTNNAGAMILAVVDASLYVGSVADTNELPGGSLDESQFQVIQSWSDWGGTDNVNQVQKVYVRNISAGTVTIICKSQARVIANTATPATS